ATPRCPQVPQPDWVRVTTKQAPVRQGQINRKITRRQAKSGHKKTRLVGRVDVAAIRRALTHHSMNGANNQRNTDVEAVHAVDLR
ncbi:hypothetical protein PQQ52_28440, partial [Paraburkholderia sediminicola]|uniref:hypothetical protein n=1 Tax=Paraburkholderia sediminicola TaxID=458836 RepID=UPI0038B9603E